MGKDLAFALVLLLFAMSCSNGEAGVKLSGENDGKDTLSFSLFFDDEELQAMDPHAFWLVDRMMHMYEKVETARDNWDWMQAVNGCVVQYNGRLGRMIGSSEMALLAIEELMDVYCNGGQASMNTAAYVFNVLADYRTTFEYCRLVSLLNDDNGKLGELYFKEYCEWYNMNRALHSLMCSYTYALARYSARSMDVNGISEAWFAERLELLKKECSLICFGVEDSLKASDKSVGVQDLVPLLEYYKGRTGQVLIDEIVEEGLDVELYRPGIEQGYNYELVLRNVSDFESAFVAWGDVRESVALMLPVDKQPYYKALTGRIQCLLYGYLNDLRELLY